MLDLAEQAERGVWWRAGGISDQPAQYYRAMRVAAAELRTHGPEK